ncbi:Uncharacterized protein APZ42_021595 [Daphnia magna]|uniref:Uncharacterized protein n=1 Tax=Daphnia magna TaxID=35525 RepID=A0A0P5YPQ7_9CRUS|nr:Uncharacterized protein APZ42_021595 [Daphnia magna]
MQKNVLWELESVVCLPNKAVSFAIDHFPPSTELRTWMTGKQNCLISHPVNFQLRQKCVLAWFSI